MGLLDAASLDCPNNPWPVAKVAHRPQTNSNSTNEPTQGVHDPFVNKIPLKKNRKDCGIDLSPSFMSWWSTPGFLYSFAPCRWCSKSTLIAHEALILMHLLSELTVKMVRETKVEIISFVFPKKMLTSKAGSVQNWLVYKCKYADQARCGWSWNLPKTEGKISLKTAN